jgi:hypothetical protein
MKSRLIFNGNMVNKNRKNKHLYRIMVCCEFVGHTCRDCPNWWRLPKNFSLIFQGVCFSSVSKTSSSWEFLRTASRSTFSLPPRPFPHSICPSIASATHRDRGPLIESWRSCIQSKCRWMPRSSPYRGLRARRFCQSTLIVGSDRTSQLIYFPLISEKGE